MHVRVRPTTDAISKCGRQPFRNPLWRRVSLFLAGITRGFRGLMSAIAAVTYTFTQSRLCRSVVELGKNMILPNSQVEHEERVFRMPRAIPAERFNPVMMPS